MKASPLTLQRIEFIRVHIEPDLEAETERASEFQFDGASLAWGLDSGRDEDNDTWWVAVGFGTDDESGEPRCPYILDVQAVGIVSVSGQYPRRTRTRVRRCSRIWSHSRDGQQHHCSQLGWAAYAAHAQFQRRV